MNDQLISTLRTATFNSTVRRLASRHANNQTVAEAMQLSANIFHVSHGDATEDSPLVMTIKKKHYAPFTTTICEMLLESEGLDGELKLRGYLDAFNIVVYEFNVKPKCSTYWSGTKKYYFDVSIFNKNIDRPWWKLWGADNSTSISTVIRWLTFLPLAITASWLATFLASTSTFQCHKLSTTTAPLLTYS